MTCGVWSHGRATQSARSARQETYRTCGGLHAQRREQRAARDRDEPELRAIGEEIGQRDGDHLASSSSSIFLTICRCRSVSRLSLARWTSSGVGRAVEDAIDEVAQHRAEHLVPRLGRTIDVRALGHGLLEVALLLENPHHRHHGGVGDLPAREERFVDVAHGRRLEPPHDFHDGELLRREGRMRCAHVATNYLVLSRQLSSRRFSEPGISEPARRRTALYCGAGDSSSWHRRRRVSRRDFTRLFAVGGSAALFVASRVGAARRCADAAARRGGPAAGEAFWKAVRAQFVMPPDLAVMNAANLCPASGPVLARADPRDRGRRPQSVAAESRPAVRRQGGHAQGARRVPARDARRDRHHPQHQRVEQPRVERARAQGRRRGRDLQRQPSRATTRRGRRKPKRFGFTVVPSSRRTRIPGPSTTSTRSRKALTPRTKVLAFTHLTNTVGDLFPAKEICAAGQGARRASRLLDGAQTFGLLRRQSARHRPGLLLRQRAQVAVWRARVRRAVRQHPRARAHLADSRTAPILARSASRARWRRSGSATRPR